jgi:hypothetical protein
MPLDPAGVPVPADDPGYEAATALGRLGALRFPQGAYEVLEAVAALPRSSALAVLGSGSDPWVRSTLRSGASVVCLGAFAVGVLDFYWPVVFFEVSPSRAPARKRLVSLAMRVASGDDDQGRQPWLVRSFVRLSPQWGLWMGDRGGGPSLVNGDDPAMARPKST